MCGFKKQTKEFIKFYIGLVVSVISGLRYATDTTSIGTKEYIQVTKKGMGKIFHRLVYVDGKNT